MAEQIKDFEFTRGRAGYAEMETWLDGKIYKLVQGVDFTVKVASVRSSINEAAKRRGKKVRSNVVDDGKAIVIQAYANPNGTPAARKK